MGNNQKKIAIVIPSCDKYSDLWPVFFNFLNKNWLDCPFEKYLVSNFSDPEMENVKTIKTGVDISWSDNLLKALDCLEEEYLLLFIDDLLLTEKVHTAKIIEMLEWCVDKKVNYFRMNPYPPPDKIVNEFAGIIYPGAIYRTSTVLSLWKKEVLQDLLQPGENAWQLEIEGSKRSDKYDGFYSARSYHFQLINSVIKSKWRRAALQYIKKFELEPDLKVREVMTPLEEFEFFLRRRRAQLFRLLPNTYRRRIKDFTD